MENEYIIKYLIKRLKEDDIPTAFVETKFQPDDDNGSVGVSAYGNNLSKDFIKYIGEEGIVWVKYNDKDNGTLCVMFNCNYDMDTTKFSKNIDLAKMVCSSPLRIDVDDILKMISIETTNINGNFDLAVADLLTAAAVIIMN